MSFTCENFRKLHFIHSILCGVKVLCYQYYTSPLTKIPFLKRLIGISRLIVEVLNDQNVFTESNLANWFSSYVQFCSGGHFSGRAEASR